MLSPKNLLLAAATITSASAQIFTLSAYLPGSPLNNARIDASGQSFYTGLPGPATYCPTVVEPNCPNVTSTIVAGMSAMWVNVPGGQQLYVAPDGHLAFTQAHSIYIPTGSFIGSFTNVTITSDCAAPVQVIGWKAPDGSTEGILACKNLPSWMNGTDSMYQIYAHIPLFNQTGCVTLGGLLPSYLPSGTTFGAWQYT